MKSLILILLLTACTGAKYQPGHNLTVYRPNSAKFILRDAAVEVDGHDCSLSNASFYVTDIHHPQEVRASMWDMSGTSRIKATPGNYVRVEVTTSRVISSMAAVGFSGAIGAAAESGGRRIISSDGPFTLTIVPEAEALEELKDLTSDCE